MKIRSIATSGFILGGICLPALLALTAAPAAAQYVMFRSTIAGGGGSSAVGSYAVAGTAGQRDAGTLSQGTYVLHGGFWLGGNGAATSVQEASSPPKIALATRIERAWPNPTHGPVELAFSLAAPLDVRADIYNLSGQRVRTLVNGPRAAGRYQVTWDGRNESGRPVGSGIYLVRMRAGSEEKEQKILVVH